MPQVGPSPRCPDEVAFGRAERDFVYAIARRFVHSREAADDVAQDAMLLAYRHRDSFRGASKYRSWLYRIASTTALGHLRRARRSREQLAATDEAARWEIEDPASSPETLVGDLEVAARAMLAIARLSPSYRDVVVMGTELTDPEIAVRLGITVANVKTRGHRARKQLRHALVRDCAMEDRQRSVPATIRGRAIAEP
jgi:RNA polymerase sigma-70 factor (ECF subfamily)